MFSEDEIAAGEIRQRSLQATIAIASHFAADMPGCAAGVALISRMAETG
jgi:hypothetical protein